jgi:hypothetical protein
LVWWRLSRLLLWLLLPHAPCSLCCSEGGFFNARMTFPKDYPNSPPTCRFTSEMWHPNGARDCVVVVVVVGA